jgi:phosphate:Na+ symporter
MLFLNLITQFAGATMLLLFAVRLVQTGVDRLAGGWLKRILAQQGDNRAGAAFAGFGIAALLQSATAVTLLVVGFFSAQSLGFASGLAMILGADFGSALAVQILSFNVAWLSPVLVAVGGWMFLKAQDYKWRQTGRIFLGIGLVLMALRLFRDILEPFTGQEQLQELFVYLQSDFVTAFLLGAGLTLLMHSSVAVILIVVSTVAAGVLPLAVGLSIMLGANLGSSLIPVWLCRDQHMDVKRLVLTNTVLRGSLAILFVFLFDRFQMAQFLVWDAPAQGVINGHLLFNATLLLAVPWVGRLERLSAILTPTNPAGMSASSDTDSYLAAEPHGEPAIALASMKREVLRMGKMLSDMARPIIAILKDPSAPETENIREVEERMNAALTGIRNYSTELPFSTMSKAEKREARNLIDNAVDLEAAGDIITRQLLRIAKQKDHDQLVFSREGLSELRNIHDNVVENLDRALAVLTTGDKDIARQVTETKAHIRNLERQSRKRHFKRLQNGVAESLGSSNIHLDTLHALKELNAKITSVTYPALAAEGQLLDTRLVPQEQDRS